MLKPCLQFIILCICISATRQVIAEPTPEVEQRLLKARLLYTCFSFSKAMFESSSDPEQKAKLRRISTNFLALATSEVVAVDEDKNPLNTELEQKYGKLGQSDFMEFLNKVKTLPTEKERNEKLGEFASSCLSAVKP